MRVMSALIVVGILLSTAGAVTAQPVDHAALVVFLVTEPEVYDVGDTMGVEVHVFRRGEPTRSTDVSVQVDLSERDVPLEEVSTGVYAGSFTIEDGDVDAWGVMEVVATAEDNATGEVAHDSLEVAVLEDGPFTVEILFPECGDRGPGPGQEVQVRVETRWLGEYIVPDKDFFVRVYPPEGGSEGLTMYWHGDGRYQDTYVVPEDIARAGRFTVTARGEHSVKVSDNPTWYFTFSDGQGAYFYLDFYDVWARVRDVGTASSRLDLHVAGPDGRPLGGANVSLTWEYLDADHEEVRGSWEGVTSADGSVEVTLDHADLGPRAHYVQVTGEVTHGGLVQELEGFLHPRGYHRPPTSTPHPLSGEVLTPQPLELGREHTVEQRLLLNGTPLADTAVCYYYVRSIGVYGHGNATTDGEGVFSATMTAPSSVPGDDNLVVARYYVEMPDGHWEHYGTGIAIGPHPLYDDLDAHLDPRVELEVSEFSRGDLVHVTLDHPLAGEHFDAAYVMWGIGDWPDWDGARDLGWENWNPGSNNDMRTMPLEWRDGRFEGSFYCPYLVPEGETLFFYGHLVHYDEDRGTTDHAAVIEGVRLAPFNQEPEVTIVNLKEGKRYGGRLTVRGEAMDDGQVQVVQVRVDDGKWQNVTGTAEWQWSVYTEDLGEGNRTVRARAFDGLKWSEPASVDIVVDQSVVDEGGDGVPGPGAGAVGVVLLVATVVSRAFGRRGGKVR